MNETLTDDVPSSWDEIEKGKSTGGQDWLSKIKSGEPIRLRILTGPLAFSQLYTKVGDKNKSINLQFGQKVPGHEPRAQYLFEVLVLDGSQAGMHKLWSCGQQVAEQLKKIRGIWGDISKCDINVEKTGEGLSTKWRADGVPPTDVKKEHLTPVFNLREKLKYATPEEIASLPKQAAPKDDMNSPASVDQAKVIESLASAKDMSFADVEKIILRKFEKKIVSFDDLTRTQASQLIDILKAL